MNIDQKKHIKKEKFEGRVSGVMNTKNTERSTLIENEKKKRVIEFSLDGIEFVLINLCVYGVFGIVCEWDACVCVLYLSFEYTNKILESFINVRERERESGGVEVS